MYSEGSSDSSVPFNPDEKRSSLHKAAAENDVGQLTKLLSQSLGLRDLNAQNLDSKTPLHEAAIKNVGQSHYEVAEILLKNGADPNARDEKGKTSLFYLVENGTVEIVQLFLSYKADLSVLDNYGRSALLGAATENYKNPEVVQLLVDQGLNVNGTGVSGGKDTILHAVACRNKGDSHFEVIKIFLNNGAHVNTLDYECCTPLDYLVSNGTFEIVKWFLTYYKTDDCVLSKEKMSSLLMTAVWNSNNPKVVQLLLDLGSDVNYRESNRGRSPLHEAALSNSSDSHYGVCETLLKNGADINALDFRARTPLHYLVRYGNMRIVNLFLDYKADVFAGSKNGRSILFSFCEFYGNHNNVEVLQKMIDLGLDVNQEVFNKETPLHNFFKNGLIHVNTKNFKCFIRNGANINAIDDTGMTPLVKGLKGFREFDDDWLAKNKGCLNILLEQNDFSVVRNCVHIFNYYSSYNNSDLKDNSKYLWKWILEHLAKLKFLSIPIHPDIQKFIEDHITLKTYFEMCTKELEVVSNTKLRNSWLTFFNLLVDNRRKIKNYVGNEDLIEDFENNDWVKKFPVYGEAIKKNIEKGLKRRKLFDESAILLSDYLPIFNPDHLIVRDILDCILSKKDLYKLSK